MSATRPVHVSVEGYGGRARRRGLVVHRTTTLTAAAKTVRRRIPVITPSARSPTFAAALRQALETCFLALCRRHRLAPPDVNVRLGPYTVDFMWPAHRVVVETDGWKGHRGRQAFEDDRRRDAWLRARGFEVLRFSWRQVVDEPRATVDVLFRYGLARSVR